MPKASLDFGGLARLGGPAPDPRGTVVAEANNAQPSGALSPYLSNVVIGDDFGKLTEFGARNVFFVHPGRTTPTRFAFNVKKFRAEFPGGAVSLNAEIDPRVPPEAITRGGGTAHIVVSAGGKEWGQAVVRPGQPFTLQVPPTAGDMLDISVDANGAPDTNWLLLTFK
ncbi:hypothetical protein J5J86_20075 [Aquabacter sp. L1I39]|uniref:hypothetical protein n=1 Tax=Aquabacter sp. L1I39 TaxID=2820278 RepID=UPI001ADD1F66|nr:hypothetical protein [Aquabacter sp. L1I39]QTL03035.1 hypothetical protein J5J86_20075 [Aquabacter sp. L1I39]